MSTFLRDLRFTCRQMVKNPALTLITVLVLALGIGANTAIFSMVYGVLIRPLPYEKGEDLVLIRQQILESRDVRFSVPEYFDYRDQNQTFEALVEYHKMSFSLLGGEEPRQVQAGVVSVNFFDVLGTKPVRGRSFVPRDGEPGAEPVLMLSHGFWQRALGGDPSVVGRTFEMNDKVHTVIGILSPVPEYPDENDVYIPVSLCPLRSTPRVEGSRTGRMLSVFGRLKPGVTVPEADSDVEVIANRLQAEYPEVYGDGGAGGYAAAVVPLRETLIGNAYTTLLVLLGTVVLVLLICCVNLANLTFARLIQRKREFAVRSALGANRGRLILQLLLESSFLALLGGALGLVFARAGMDVLTTFAGRFTSRAGEIAIDGPVLGFTLLVSLATGILICLVPAVSIGRDAGAALREGGGNVTEGRGLKRLRNALIVAELAGTFVLLICFGLMVRSFWRLQQVDAGFDASDVLGVQITLNRSHYTNPEQFRGFFTSLIEKVEALPGVVSASLGMSLPLDEAQELQEYPIEVEGGSTPDGQSRPRADFQLVSARFFDTLGIPLLSGRLFADSDTGSRPNSAIVSSAVARRYWGDVDPVGKWIVVGPTTNRITIAGVVGDVRHEGLDTDVTDIIYLPYFQMSQPRTNLLVRCTGDPRQLVRPVTEAVYRIDPEQPVSAVRTLGELRRKSIASPRLTATLLGLFAGLALVIATAGLGAVIAFTVSRRTKEIGLHMALGARHGGVLWMAFREPMMLVGLGLVIGMIGALFSAKVMSSLLFGIEAYDPATLVGAAIFLTMVTGATCLLAARRALLVDPVVALRCE